MGCDDQGERVATRFMALAIGAALSCCSSGSTPPMPDASSNDLSAPSDFAVDGASDMTERDLAPALDLTPPPPDLAGVDLAELVCYGPGASFPSFPNACMADKDCFAGIHQIDCCGSHAAYGFSEAQHKAFDAAEAVFRVVCPANCKCVARPTLCEDGKTAPDGQVTVTCEAGHCTSHGL